MALNKCLYIINIIYEPPHKRNVL